MSGTKSPLFIDPELQSIQISNKILVWLQLKKYCTNNIYRGKCSGPPFIIPVPPLHLVPPFKKFWSHCHVYKSVQSFQVPPFHNKYTLRWTHRFCKAIKGSPRRIIYGKNREIPPLFDKQNIHIIYNDMTKL